MDQVHTCSKLERAKSWTMGRSWRILSSTRSGCTRLVKNTTETCASGSIHAEQPVYPKCPNVFFPILEPAEEPFSDFRSNPMPRGRAPRGVCRVIIRQAVSFESHVLSPLIAACQAEHHFPRPLWVAKSPA